MFITCTDWDVFALLTLTISMGRHMLKHGYLAAYLIILRHIIEQQCPRHIIEQECPIFNFSKASTKQKLTNLDMMFTLIFSKLGVKKWGGKILKVSSCLKLSK